MGASNFDNGSSRPSANEEVAPSDKPAVQAPTTEAPTPDRVKESYDFFAYSFEPIGNVSMRDIVAQNLKLIKCGRIIAKWRNATDVEQPPQRENARIKSRDILGLAGSAIYEQALPILIV